MTPPQIVASLGLSGSAALPDGLTREEAREMLRVCTETAFGMLLMTSFGRAPTECVRYAQEAAIAVVEDWAGVRRGSIWPNGIEHEVSAGRIRVYFAWGAP